MCYLPRRLQFAHTGRSREHFSFLCLQPLHDGRLALPADEHEMVAIVVLDFWLVISRSVAEHVQSGQFLIYNISLFLDGLGLIATKQFTPWARTVTPHSNTDTGRSRDSVVPQFPFSWAEWKSATLCVVEAQQLTSSQRVMCRPALCPAQTRPSQAKTGI